MDGTRSGRRRVLGHQRWAPVSSELSIGDRQVVSGPATTGLDPRVGWALVAALTLLVLVTWMPSMGAALGDNHEGRILGRHALHITNAWEHGIVGSSWLSDARPYTTSYAHHPPLMNFAYYLTSSILPGELSFSLRLFAYLSGVAMIPVGTALLRRLGFGWSPVILAAGTVAVTPLFWNYGRLHGSVTLTLAMALFAVRLREERPIPRGELLAACLISMAAIVASYVGLAVGALLGLWVLRGRGLDRVTLSLGVAMAAAAAVSLAYIIGNTGAADIGEQIEFRTTGGEFTAEEFRARLQRWRQELLPAWWRFALVWIGVAAGLLDQRTRYLTTVFGVVALAYIYGLPNGSFIHDYWIFPLLLPVWLGTAAAFQAVLGRVSLLTGRVVVGVTGALLLIAATGLLLSDIPDEYFREPEAAGELAARAELPPEQRFSWAAAAIPTPRWHVYYWDLPRERWLADSLLATADEELVLVRLDRLPDWLAERQAVEDAAIDVEGRYAILDGATLRRLAGASS